MKLKIFVLAVLFSAKPAHAELPTDTFIQTECHAPNDFRIIISLNTITHAADSAVPAVRDSEPGAYVYVPHKGIFVYDRLNVTFIADKETGMQSAFRFKQSA
jgi:hypothetical protein